MRTNSILEAKEKLSGQVKFARENFSGVEKIGKEIRKIADAYHVDRKEFAAELRAKEKAGEITSDEYYDKLYTFKDYYVDQIQTLLMVASIKITTALGHAVSGSDVETIKGIIKFLDETAVGESMILSDVKRFARTRSLDNVSIIEMAAIFAAQKDDLDFIKELEAFAAKNKGRENIYDWFEWSYKRFGEMDVSSLNKFGNRQRIALEAIVNGSKNVYDYVTQGKGIQEDYILKFIEINGYWIKKLTKEEVAKVIEIEPKFFEPILDNMPENLPDHIVDIFIF